MERYSGKPIYKGTVIGRICFYTKNQNRVKRQRVEDTRAEIARFHSAVEQACLQLHDLYEKAVQEVGETNAMIFEVHSMLLEDGDFNDSICNIIQTEGVNAEYAVATTGDNFADMFSQMEDEYFQARSADIRDISERLIGVLQGRSGDGEFLKEPVILVAEDLAPSETVQMDKSKLLSLVTRHGSSNSHTAILARTMMLPSLIGVDIDESWNGRTAVVDAVGGQIILDPDEATLEHYRGVAAKEAENRELLQTLKGKPNVTRDGKEILLYANIGNAGDVAGVLANEGAGIGLFRSEFLYLEKDHYPTEEEQFQVYKTVAQNMAGRRVVIRTLDIGADKQVDYFELEPEENPAMGYRAIRICLDRVEVFKTQLRALYRASAYGKISIMFPMIISLEEVREIKGICEEVRRELQEDKISFGEVELGIMIETPAAALISDLLAGEVDFFSIGTNDLTQYTLAVDRQNPKLDKQYNAHHEAVLRLIRMVIENGHAKGCWVGICGELAADTSLTERFVQMGIDELSVSPSFLLQVRKAIRESVAECSDH